MSETQPQLIADNFVLKDIVYTPEVVARDMVNFFEPSGRVLEPCRGEGVFMKYLPGADWCEIREGRDFFACHNQYNWIIGNPPYSCFGKWIYHAMDIAENIVYLVPCAKPFYSEKLYRTMQDWGMIKHIRIYGSGNKLGFPIGFLIGAIHFQRGYFGPTYTTNAIGIWGVKHE
jgi:hypothetical protein